MPLQLPKPLAPKKGERLPVNPGVPRPAALPRDLPGFAEGGMLTFDPAAVRAAANRNPFPDYLRGGVRDIVDVQEPVVPAPVTQFRTRIDSGDFGTGPAVTSPNYYEDQLASVQGFLDRGIAFDNAVVQTNDEPRQRLRGDTEPDQPLTDEQTAAFNAAIRGVAPLIDVIGRAQTSNAYDEQQRIAGLSQLEDYTPYLEEIRRQQETYPGIGFQPLVAAFEQATRKYPGSETVNRVVGNVAEELVGHTALGYIPGAEGGAGDAARFVTPDTYLDLALELAPGVGTVPGVSSAIRGMSKEVLRELPEAGAKRLLDDAAALASQSALPAETVKLFGRRMTKGEPLRVPAGGYVGKTGSSYIWIAPSGGDIPLGNNPVEALLNIEKAGLFNAQSGDTLLLPRVEVAIPETGLKMSDLTGRYVEWTEQLAKRDYTKQFAANLEELEGVLQRTFNARWPGFPESRFQGFAVKDPNPLKDLFQTDAGDWLGQSRSTNFIPTDMTVPRNTYLDLNAIMNHVVQHHYPDVLMEVKGVPPLERIVTTKEFKWRMAEQLAATQAHEMVHRAYLHKINEPEFLDMLTEFYQRLGGKFDNAARRGDQGVYGALGQPFLAFDQPAHSFLYNIRKAFEPIPARDWEELLNDFTNHPNEFWREWDRTTEAQFELGAGRGAASDGPAARPRRKPRATSADAGTGGDGGGAGPRLPESYDDGFDQSRVPGDGVVGGGGGDAVPPASGMASARGPEPASRGSYLFQPRGVDEFAGEVVTKDEAGRLVNAARSVVAASGINPSLGLTGDVGKIITGTARRTLSDRTNASQAVGRALGKHRNRFTGQLPVHIDADGLAHVGNKRVPWQDVAENIDDYALSARGRAFLLDVRKLARDTEVFRRQNGLQAIGDLEKPYVPRQAAELRGIDVTTRPRPAMPRTYTTAEEGLEAGVKYSNDPFATMDRHVRTALAEVRAQDLKATLETHSIRASQAVSGEVKQRYAVALQAKLSAQRARNRLTIPVAVKRAVVGETPRALRAVERGRTALAAQREAANEALIAITKEYNSAKQAYHGALERAKRANQLPGNLFGRAEAEIPVKEWNNRLFPQLDAKKLEKVFGDHGFRPQETTSPPAKLANTLVGWRRRLQSGHDMGTQFIHGLFTFGRNPVVFGRATGNALWALVDNTTLARVMENHKDLLEEMVQYGTTAGDIEITRQAGEDVYHIGDRTKLLPGGETLNRAGGEGLRQTSGRFQNAYDTWLLVARLGHTDALRGIKSLDAATRQELVRDMTGGLESAALGIHKTQRAAEGFWMAYSPKLMRSTLALAYHAANPTTPRGREALRTLASTAAAVSATYAAVGLAMGKDWEEIERGLNPLDGVNFMRYKIGEGLDAEWIGVGGQMRAVIQLLAKGGEAVYGASTGDMTALNDFGKLTTENPLLAYFTSRGAPALSEAAKFGEAMTGTNLAPYDDIDGLQDFGQTMLTDSAPFAMQSLQEHASIEAVMSNFVGFSDIPVTAGQVLRDTVVKETIPALIEQGVLSKELAGKGREALGPGEDDAVKRWLGENRPDLLPAYEAGRRGRNNVFQRAQDMIRTLDESDGGDKAPQGFKQHFDQLWGHLLAGTDPALIWDDLSDSLEVRSNLIGQKYDDSGATAAIEKLEDNDIRKVDFYWQELYGLAYAEAGQLKDENYYAVLDKMQAQFKGALLAADPAMAARFEADLALRDKTGDLHPLIGLKRNLDEYNAEYRAVRDTQGDDAASDYLRANPTVNATRWLLYSTEPRTVEAARQIVDTGIPRPTSLYGYDQPITADTIVVMERYAEQINKLTSKLSTYDPPGSVSTEKTELRKNSLTYDALHYWLGGGDPGADGKVVVYHSPTEILRIVSQWGHREDGAMPRLAK